MHDLLLRGGRVIDASRGLDGIADVAFADGRVAEVAPDISPTSAREARDVSGRLVVPGLIDLHTHVYWGGTSLGVEADALVARSGTTTFVDAGSAGPGNFVGFRRHVIERSRARILAYLNISFAGIFGFSRTVMVPECGDLRLLDAEECVRVAAEHRDLIVGVKVRVGRNAGGASGVAPLDIALEAAEELGLPVMAHCDLPPPTLPEVLARLRPGDVLTHCFRPFPNAPLVAGERIRPQVEEARRRGIVFDIGHGMGSFGFAVARGMLGQEFWPDTISSDVHALCVDGPAFDLLVTMSKLLCLGMPLIEVIRAATAKPAEVLRRPGLGSLGPGAVGDATVLELQEGAFEYTDVLGEVVRGDRRLAVAGVVIGGRWWQADEALGTGPSVAAP